MSLPDVLDQKGSQLTKPTVTPLEKTLKMLQNRIDRIESLRNLLGKHPFLAPLCDLKTTSGGLVGLVVDDKAFIRPQGVNKPGLRMESWLEDTFTEVSPEDRIICDDVSTLSTRALKKLLASIPGPDDEDDAE